MTITDHLARFFGFGVSLGLQMLPGCSAQQTEGDFMFLRNEGADLPVWVRGNVESKTFLIWLSGGPGDPYEVMRGAGTELLEEDYAMVYWDQRGCGSAQGNPSPESFTMDQFVEDTDQVIELVRQRYEAENVFLIGHSWGGTLATAYLLAPDRRKKVAGWVDLAGNHDFPLVFPMKLAWLEKWAEEQIARGKRVEHWQAVAEWTRSQPPLTNDNFERWVRYVDETDAAFVDPDHDFEIDFDLLFRSGQSPLAYLLVNRHYVVDSLYHSDDVLLELSYSSRMHEISIPVLMLWGRGDGIVPLEAGQAALASVGTPLDQRRMVILEDSGHFTFLEQPTEFAAAIGEFVDANVY